jgi:hypothetical protein
MILLAARLLPPRLAGLTDCTTALVFANAPTGCSRGITGIGRYALSRDSDEFVRGWTGAWWVSAVGTGIGASSG